jgi:hypothetical protein
MQSKTSKSASEVLLQITADQNRDQAEIFQLNRNDLLLTNIEGKYDMTEFNLEKDSVLSFDKQIYNINGMEVVFYPFVWNGCQLTLDKKPGIQYQKWATRWIDINDKKQKDSTGVQNVIHNITFPSEDGGKWQTSIDLGTAPTEALKELLSILSRQGIKKIEVHSKTFTN